MDFIDGQEILDIISNHDTGCYTEIEAKKLFKQILEGI